jgi:hypothetical protein
MKTIEFTIKDGETKMDLKGFEDGSCKNVGDAFKSLGAQTHEVLKAEYYNECDNTQKVSSGA